MVKRKLTFREDFVPANTPLWHEALFAAEILLLHTSPTYYGLGVSRGDGSAVVLLPGFLLSDLYLTELHSWLNFLGYRAYFSGIRINADCPNLLIRHRVNRVVDRALKKTARKVHLVGHSLGGIIARSVAAQRPQDIASVITLGSPFRGTVAHDAILEAAAMVRDSILCRLGDEVLPECYTGRCGCDFLNALKCALSEDVLETAIFTRNDGVVDWRYCLTGDAARDFEVNGTHVGLTFNASVYSIIADRLALARKTSALETESLVPLRLS